MICFWAEMFQMPWKIKACFVGISEFFNTNQDVHSMWMYNVMHPVASCFWCDGQRLTMGITALFVHHCFLNKPFQRRQGHLETVTEWMELTIQCVEGWQPEKPGLFCRSGPSDVRALRSLMWASSVIPPPLLGSFASTFHQSLCGFLRYEKIGLGPVFWTVFLTLLCVLMLRDRPHVWGPRSNASLFDKIILCMWFLLWSNMCQWCVWASINCACFFPCDLPFRTKNSL